MLDNTISNTMGRQKNRYFLSSQSASNHPRCRNFCCTGLDIFERRIPLNWIWQFLTNSIYWNDKAQLCISALCDCSVSNVSWDENDDIMNSCGAFLSKILREKKTNAWQRLTTQCPFQTWGCRGSPEQTFPHCVSSSFSQTDQFRQQFHSQIHFWKPNMYLLIFYFVNVEINFFSKKFIIFQNFLKSNFGFAKKAFGPCDRWPQKRAHRNKIGIKNLWPGLRSTLCNWPLASKFCFSNQLSGSQD